MLLVSGISIQTRLSAQTIDPASLARRYAPIIVHDSAESSPLSSAEAQLELGVHLRGDCASDIPPIRLQSANFWQDSEVQQIAQNCKNLALDFGRQIAPPQAILYYHLVESGLYISLSYWMFYSWNSTAHMGNPLVTQCGSHEGDWEHIAIRLDRQLLANAQSEADFQQAINDLYFAQHNRAQNRKNKYYRPSNSRLRFTGNQIQVYPALGTHASLPWPGKWPLITLMGQTLFDSNDGKGLKVKTAALLPLQQMHWFNYPGKWGADQHDHCNLLEHYSSASNDGANGPGHGNKIRSHIEGDWFDFYRPYRFYQKQKEGHK